MVAAGEVDGVGGAGEEWSVVWLDLGIGAGVEV